MSTKKIKLGFGVNQTEKISEAANIVNETPKDFIINSTKEYLKELSDELLELSEEIK